ncbi:dolichyl-diphosphooligosaccharide--protein glycosyltransferase subunit 2-like [Cynara cardunculus var. scolymus]|uniref:dolichyl-diphosphooligosaccharide--protein glycosyltransferase subunit 2-like n=1 Tax=Cynara cardunculus var. scolymus TaxID=59895 RepID=UPI000D626B0E|nr:dolichyl-diphosphooligosaccharide--protein glycosyltransferase subunit 2-like [Cynara cardunculus var. scolymus]
MARSLGFIIVLLAVTSICDAVAIFHPISESHRSAALELFSPAAGSFSGLEEAYEALRTFEVLGIEKPDTKDHTCNSVVDTLSSSSSNLKDLYHSLRVNGLLKCKTSKEALTGTVSRLKGGVKEATTLLDYYYSVGGLLLVKDQSSEVDVLLGNADGILRSIKALSQSDGRWRYSSNNPASSTYAAGVALETLSGVISLAASAIDENLIGTLKNDIVKLFDSIEKYDDGAYYFDDKVIDASGHQGPLSATSAVVRGLTTFASTSGTLNIPEEKILGLARFFLGVGVPGNSKDLYYQIDALSCLENNRVSVPLILSLPATVLSLTSNDKLKVRVNTVLGSIAPPLSVKLMQVFSSGSKDAPVLKEELKFDPKEAIHTMDALPEGVDIGEYVFAFEIVLSDPEDKRKYATGGRTKVPIHVTGVVGVDNAKLTLLEGDSVESEKKLNLPGKNDVALSANHLQKLHLSFLLTTPLGKPFKPHQALFKLRHETGVEHIFVVGNSGKQFKIALDFLGLVEKFFYLSGQYDIELIVGDAAMENSFLQPLGYVELDLPKVPEKATRPPSQAVDPYLRYGPKAEINHIFRVPEKRPPQEVSFAFLGLVFVPFLVFLIGLLRLGVNLKNFPTSTVPATFAILFHGGIAAVLLLYVFFWLKLDLFTTLKALGVIGIFLMFVGHSTLSHIASVSVKVKSA